MSPMPPDNILEMAGLLAPKSKAAAGMAVAPSPVRPPMAAPSEQVGPNGYVTGMPPPEILAMASSGIQVVGGREARMAMFPDEFKGSGEDKPNIVMRGIMGITAGIADMAPSTMALAAGVIDFLGADEAGAALGQQALDVSSWLNDHLAVENPTLYDHAMRGVGSMLTFIIPGLGAASAAGKVAKAAGMAGNAAKAFRALTGGGAMSFLEAAVEQSQREMELIGKGMTPEQAMKESAPVFWYNMGVLTATNTAGYFLPLPIKTKNEFVRRAAKAVEAAFTEGGQERAQAVIQDVASGAGEWGDFLDPNKNVTDTLVGAIVGGGTAALLPGEADTPQNAPGAPVANAPAPPSPKPSAPPTPQQAPAQAAQPAEPPLPPAAPAAPIPEPVAPPPPPANLPMQPAEDFEVWTGEDDFSDVDEEGARGPVPPPPADEPPLTRTPAEQEKPEWARKPEPVAPLSTFENQEDGVRAEVRRREDGQYAVSVQDIDSGERFEDPRIFPAQELAEGYARKVTEPKPAKPAKPKAQAAAERKAREQAEAAAVNAEAQRRMEAAKPVEPVPAPDKNAVVNEEYADPAAASDVDELERQVQRNKQQVQEIESKIAAAGANPPPSLYEHRSDLLKSRKQFGFQLAAARRRLTGALTDIEKAAEDKRRASNYVGKPVSIRRPDGTAVNGKIVGTPFGRVSVELETGEKITVDKENIGTPVEAATQAAESQQEAPAPEQTEVVGHHATALDVPDFQRRAGNLAVHMPGRKKFHPGDIGAWFAVDHSRRPGSGKNAADVFGQELTSRSGEPTRTISARLKIGNPKVYADYESFLEESKRFRSGVAFQKSLTDQGYDGIRILESRTDGGGLREDWVAFNAEQIEMQRDSATQTAAPAAPSPAAASGIVSMPTSALTVSKPGEFQKRENVDNEESQTNEAKMQAIMADFKAERLTPIVAWRDPVDGKLKVLDGHHTLEAAKRAGIENVNVREFKGTREEATTEAEILNDLRTANDPLSRAATVRRRRAAGMSEADIEAEARPRYQEATPTVLQLSFLNPNGQLVAAIKQFMGTDQDSDTTGNLMKIAKWIGEARRRNPNLTDAHEGEMFDVLRREMARDNKPAWASKNETFLKHVRGIVSAPSFDASGAINLYQDKHTQSEREYDAELQAAEDKVVAAEAAVQEVTDELDGLFPVLDEKGNPKRHKSGKLKGRVMKALVPGKAVADEDTRARRLAPAKYALELAKQDLGAVIAKKESYIARDRDQGGLFRLGRPSLASLNKAAAARGLSPAVTVQPRDLMDEMVMRVARMFGFKNVQFVSGLATKDGRIAHGYYQAESDTVFLNIDSNEPMLTVLMHEVGHRMEMEHPDLYGQLIQILNDPANVRVGGKEVYAKDAKARGYGEVGVESEWVADGLMEASSRPEFWNVIQEKNPTLAGKLVQMIVDAMKAIRKMFAASGASVDIYYTNFGPLVRQIANVAAQMQAREADLARASRPATAQQSMFRVSKSLRKIATWFSGTGTLEAVLPGATGVHAVEYSPEIIAQYNKAYGTNHTARDVTEIDPLEVAQTGADHFHASPVCKNFSKAKRNRGSNDLDIASARAVVNVILKAGIPSITIENVVDYIGTEPYKMIIEALDAAGYKKRTVKVNAADYGGAQNRTRMIIQAVKEGDLPPLPEETGPSDWFATIEDLLPTAQKSTVEAERKRGRGWNWEPDRIAKMVERGELDADLPIITMGGSTDKVRAWASNAGGPAPTIKATQAETIRIIMPDGTVYRATPRMMARLMGMPDSFKIPEDYGFAKKVLGNGIHGNITKAFIEPLVNGERGTSPVSEETAGQIDLFRVAPIANPLANEMRDRQDAAMKANNQHRHQGWSAGWRHVYMMMVDKHTFTYAIMRDIVKESKRGLSLVKNPYIALRRFGSWMSAVEVALKHGVYSWDGKTVLAPGLEQIIKKHGLADAIDSREFGMFYTAATLVSRKYSLASRGKDFFGDDPTSDEYQAAEDEFLKWQKIYDDYRKAHPKWEDAVADFTSYAYALIRRSYEAGVINESEFDNLTKTYSVYAPLFVIDSSRYNVDRGDPIGAGTAAHEMTRFDPTAVRMDPIDALIKQTYHMEFFTRRNEAARKHADFIRAYRDKSMKGVTVLPGFGMRVKPKTDPVAKRVKELLEAAGLSEAEIAALGRTPEQLEREAKLYVTSRIQPDGVIALLRNGNVEYWQLEPDIYESFMAATGPKASHPLMKFFSAQTSLLRAGAVLTPDFMARNQFRDFASAAIISQHLIRNPIDPFLVPLRIMRGLSHAIKKDNVYLEFMLEAGHAQLTAQDQNGLRKSSEAATRESRTRAQRAGQFVKNPAKYVLHSHPITILQEFGKLTENSSRIAVYEKTKADLLGMGMSEAEARVKAAMEARESSIDFSRSGTYGQVINQIIPFFNAAVQGNDKAFRTFVRDSGGRGSAWLKATMLVTVPSVILWSINHDDDWYKEQPVWLKNNFWLFSVDGGKTIHKLPKPFEIGLMYASLAERFLDWNVDKDPKAMKEWSEAVLKNVVAVNDKNPVASVGGLLGPMAGTMTEIVSNYDSFRGTPIVKGWLEEVAPREQYNANTSEFAKALGGMAPGNGISPMMIDHFIRGTFGGLGVYAAQAASEVIMMARPELKAMKPSDKQIRTLVGAEVPDWIPVIKAFAAAGPSGYTRQMNDFFEIYDRGREASKTLQAFKASGAPREKFISLYRRAGADLATFKASQEVAEKLGQLSKRARFIESMPAEQMSRDEKRKQIDQLTETRNLMVVKFLERYYQVDQRELQRQIEASIPQLERAYGR